MILGANLRNNPRVLSRGRRYLSGISQVTLHERRFIYPRPDKDLTNSGNIPYNPFSYYENQVPPAIVTACVGSNTTAAFSKAAPIHFHTVFASLHQEPEANLHGVLEWIRHFGIPRKELQQHAEARSKKYNMMVSIPVEYVLKDIKLFHFAMKINSLRQSLLINPTDLATKDELSSLLVRDLESKTPFVVYDQKELADRLSYSIDNNLLTREEATRYYKIHIEMTSEKMKKSPVLYASKALRFLIDLSKIHPQYDISKKMESVITWIAEDPLSAMWGMLAFDTKESRLLRQCIAPGCYRFFEAKRPSRKYCSDLCKNRAKVHRFRHQ